MSIREIYSSIQKNEWRFIAIVAVVIIMITAIPYVYGAFHVSEGATYTGLHYLTPGDTNTYLATIQAVAENTNSFINLYTSEAQRPLYVNPLWTTLGLSARWTGLSALAVFHIARSVLAAAFIVLMYMVLATFFTSKRMRKAGLLFIVFTSGLGAFFAPLFYSVTQPEHRPVDIWVPESIPFLTLYHSPHLIFSLILLVTVFFLMRLAFTHQRMSYAACAGIAGCILVWAHPFHAPTVVVVLGMYVLVSSIIERRILWSWIRMYILFGILLIPAVAYLFIIRHLDAVIAQWTAGNILPSPSPVMYVVAFLPLGIFAIYALRPGLFKNESTRFAIVWLIMSAVLVYVPVDFQRRMIEGLYIPLGILATIGFFHIWQGTFAKRYGHALRTILIISCAVFLPMTNIQMVGQDIYLYKHMEGLPYELSADEQHALAWLHEQTPIHSVVLTSHYFGNFIPPYTLRRAYIGHGPQTIDLPRKAREVSAFYTGAWSLFTMQEFLEFNRIGYIYVGTKERAYGNMIDFTILPFLTEVFSSSSVQVYQVTLAQP